MLMKVPFFHYSSLIVFAILSLIVFLSTVIPFFNSQKWYIRVLDYPRLQTFIVALVTLIWYLAVYHHNSLSSYVIIGLLLIAIVIQGYKAFPYTALAPKQVKWTTAANDDRSISLFISNVEQKNDSFQLVIDKVRKYKSDLVITTESDERWGNALAAIKDEYPHSVEVPLNNTYGMHLFSRLPLREASVRYLITSDIPSISTEIQLRSGEWIHLFIVHPRPPFPTEDDDTKERDAELVLVGREARKLDGPVIIAGDFNDVAWSATTELFQEVSGLIDPRRGRGFYNTFHAKWPIFRWPLDHIFHSQHFQLLHIEKGDKVNSDHFPMFVKLNYEPQNKSEQEKVEKDEDTDEKAAEKIEEGIEK